jgi:hypothetical protein
VHDSYDVDEVGFGLIQDAIRKLGHQKTSQSPTEWMPATRVLAQPFIGSLDREDEVQA